MEGDGVTIGEETADTEAIGGMSGGGSSKLTNSWGYSLTAGMNEDGVRLEEAEDSDERLDNDDGCCVPAERWERYL